jgi:hypothetical protein
MAPDDGEGFPIERLNPFKKTFHYIYMNGIGGYAYYVWGKLIQDSVETLIEPHVENPDVVSGRYTGSHIFERQWLEYVNILTTHRNGVFTRFDQQYFHWARP